MPTWRDANPDFINQAIPDFKQLDEICKKQGVLFLLKLHMATKITFEKEQWNNIVFIPNHFDVYPLLPFSSTLLTDYSSIFLDYQLLKKEIVFYPFDSVQSMKFTVINGIILH
jgi:CDP-glycerol glycerophosphotransferase (TagB/SpsB family)